MLRIEKAAVALDEAELMELERIDTDQDAEADLEYLRKIIYRKIELSQRARCGVRLGEGNISDSQQHTPTTI